ncbi:MAG: hypothetical protein IT167_28615 [Bryobacterales bacterium]|nr:hypothetical protein [Bryobacterales bacterium]
MAPQPARAPALPQVLPDIPEELTKQRLRRLGEGIGKVVYASGNWVVYRERSPLEMVALILLWRGLRKLESLLPGTWAKHLRDRPSRQIRLLRVLVQGAILVFPRTLWYGSHIRDVLRLYHRRSVRGEKLAQTHLGGSHLVPKRITFPPTRVSIGGWPGWLVVSEAAERVECTLFQKMVQLARDDHFEELEEWLDRLLRTRQDGWSLGLFSTDAHLKNFGVIGTRIVLLDSGGLTNRWSEVEQVLDKEEAVIRPYVRLGLGHVLAGRPEIAGRFDQRWKATVNRGVVWNCWPIESKPESTPSP